MEYGPVRHPRAQIGVLPFLQLVCAAAIGVALYVGISNWVYLGPQSLSGATNTRATTPQDGSNLGPETAAALKTQPVQPPPEPLLPFPLPKTYGVYAGSIGQLIELTQLPLKVPDARIPVSAEITNPSQAVAPNGKLSFVVFRRDLVNSAPQTVSVRVVARVAREMKFVAGKAVTTHIEGTWRIRSKSYSFRVSPLEGQREMIVIKPDPDFVLTPGRYALVLNGLGYDFTVAGPITAPEHCLEQVDTLNGAMLSECVKTELERASSTKALQSQTRR